MIDYTRLAWAVAFHRRLQDKGLSMTVEMGKHPEFRSNLENDQVYFTSPVEVADGLVLRGIFAKEEVLRRIWERSNTQAEEALV